jgi:hypothetical protein
MMLAALLLNPYAGTYAGQYRAGLLALKPCTVCVGLSGEMTVRGAETLNGDCLPDGTFDIRSRVTRWVGVFSLENGTLIGRFSANSARGVMWLTKR